MTKVQEFIAIHQLPEERFLPVTNFENRFWVSDHGRIVSHDHRKNTIAFLNPYIDTGGYYHTQLRMKPMNRKCRVHQLVGEHFCEMIATLDRMTWNHKDGNKLNNHYYNLEYITSADNIRHAVDTGLFDTKGEKHHNSKLTEEMVLQMRALYKTGLIHKDIAKLFFVDRRTAGDAINGKTWGWLT